MTSLTEKYTQVWCTKKGLLVVPPFLYNTQDVTNNTNLWTCTGSPRSRVSTCEKSSRHRWLSARPGRNLDGPCSTTWRHARERRPEMARYTEGEASSYYSLAFVDQDDNRGMRHRRLCSCAYSLENKKKTQDLNTTHLTFNYYTSYYSTLLDVRAFPTGEAVVYTHTHIHTRRQTYMHAHTQ